MAVTSLARTGHMGTRKSGQHDRKASGYQSFIVPCIVQVWVTVSDVMARPNGLTANAVPD